jgi:hypothetical protein
MPHDDDMPDLFSESLDDELEEVGREEISLPGVWAQVQRGDESKRSESSATLHDGTVVCSACPEWRHECEVRHLANMATKEMRATYLAGVETQRGRSARQRLIDSLIELRR